MHEPTTVAEIKRLFGHQFDDDIKNNGPGMEIGTQHKFGFNILVDFKAENSPLRPEAAEIMRQNNANYNPEDPCAFFYGFPLAGLLSEPIKIIQSQRVTAILYEIDGLHRQIFADGRKLPKEFDLPAHMGYSVGHWERDVFVVETAGFNDRAPLDGMLRPHSDALRVTERFHRPDFGHLEVEMTFDDPKLYTGRSSIGVPNTLHPYSVPSRTPGLKNLKQPRLGLRITLRMTTTRRRIVRNTV